MGISAWRQMHAYAASPPHLDCGIGHFQQQACTVCQAAAITVSALVGAALQELVEQVAVGTVDFYTVEAGCFGVFCALAIGVNDVSNFFSFQRARGHVILHRPDQADVPGRLEGARSHRQLAIQINRVGNTAHMPELQDDLAAGGMHRLGDGAPATHLFSRPNAGGVRVADTHWRDGRGFADDQPGAGALHVILSHHRVGHTAFISTAASQRGHDDAVVQFKLTDFNRVKKCGHQ